MALVQMAFTASWVCYCRSSSLPGFLVLFVGWSMKKEDYIDELSNGHTNNVPLWLLSTIYYLVKFVAPVTIVVVALANFIL